MGAGTKIEWATHTFNPWVGCTKVSPACDRCYAESWAKRSGHPELWAGARRRTSVANWREPLKWESLAISVGIRFGVFCASLADVFDNQVPAEWRADLWALIASTPHLDWLLLTKRPQNIAKMLPGSHVEQLLGEDRPWGDGWPNVWLGTTAENKDEFDRRWRFLAHAPASVRFLSYEPALGLLDLAEEFGLYEIEEGRWSLKVGSRWAASPDWVIAGGESGPGARPSHPDWFRSLRDQCAAAGVPFLFKQWGEWAPHKPVAGGDLGGDVRAGRVRIVHPTGQSDVEVSIATGGRSTIPGSRYMARIGKKSAGRLLDGVTHDAFPGLQPVISP